MQTAIELSSLAVDNPQTTSPAVGNSTDQKIKHGKPSVVHSYCRRAIDHGHKDCIWLGIQRGRKWIAKDVQLGSDDKPFGICELRKMSGWWKRHSMFSAIGVKEIKIRFLGINEATNEIEIVPMDFDYTNTVRDLDHALDKACNEDLEFGKCEVDVTGRSHDPNILCVNEGYDTYRSDTYCKEQHVRDLELQKEECEWLPSMLDYYWQNGIGSKGVDFLKATGFINSYDSLQYDEYLEASKPYGKTVNAFKIVEGWHLRYLLCLFAAGVLCSICVVAIVTAMNQSFQSGLTAGSYALALAGVFLAILTFLSAVL
ncbi:hypothetical protein BGZ57DRAFT_932894 [Hyaloscypha finlandica]|nr:hypothetical protein BGZ57DRAFT_932894 [Hyaloscypha finlandica]